ncbi:MAG: MaoC/PaaZ C-terminal domain-containing protein [Alphaproteobacteria bacterium]
MSDTATIDHHRLLAAPAFEQPFEYGVRETQLHALALGLGADPLDTDQLRFVYDDWPEFEAFPTQSATIGWVDMFRDRRVVDPLWGLDPNAMVVGAIEIRAERTLPAAARGMTRSRFVEAVDKGPGKAALLRARKETIAASGVVLATLDTWAFVRGGGGFGGPTAGGPARIALPERRADAVCELPTAPNLALLFRLAMGDHNALHADPGHARKVGFERPILHGIANLGIAVHAAMRAAVGYDASRIAAAAARMAGPVIPGDTLRSEFWHADASLLFRTTAVERGQVVLDGGRIELA